MDRDVARHEVPRGRVGIWANSGFQYNTADDVLTLVYFFGRRLQANTRGLQVVETRRPRPKLTN